MEPETRDKRTSQGKSVGEMTRGEGQGRREEGLAKGRGGRARPEQRARGEGKSGAGKSMTRTTRLTGN